MDIHLLSSKSRVNTYLQLDNDIYSIYRIDLTSGTLRVATTRYEKGDAVHVEPLEEFGVTTDGILCRIDSVMTKEEVRKILKDTVREEPKRYTTGDAITTDGYFPALTVGPSGGFGIKPDEHGEWSGYALLPKQSGYKPLITDRCYFSDSMRLLVPCARLLKHLLSNLGYIADPYDWQEFAIADQRKWVEFPPFEQEPK